VALFSEGDERGGVRPGSSRTGWLMLSVTALLTLVVSLLPAPYVIDQPGPTYDTLGEISVDGEAIELITVTDGPEYPEFAELRVTTVTRLGNPEDLPSWAEVVGAWLSDQRAVTPVDVAYPPGFSLEDNQEAARVEMENSQQEAVAAALTYLDVNYDSYLEVVSTLEGGPSQGVLEEGDVIEQAAGEAIRDVTRLREIIADNGTGEPLEIQIRRDGQSQAVQVVPRLSEGEEPIPVIGVLVSGRYDFPLDVTIELGSVGGPSAGLMFSLGLVEKLTEKTIADRLKVAGSGTITASGEVGPVGGIRHKVYGARQAGAQWFLVPEQNCEDLGGLEVRGLTIVPVGSLSEAIDALALAANGDVVPQCR
jgi:PDZ domain-containing protein